MLLIMVLLIQAANTNTELDGDLMELFQKFISQDIISAFLLCSNELVLQETNTSTPDLKLPTNTISSELVRAEGMESSTQLWMLLRSSETTQTMWMETDDPAHEHSKICMSATLMQTSNISE